MTTTQPPPDPPAELTATAWRLMREFVEANGTNQALRDRLGLGAGSGRVKVLFLLTEQPMTLAQLADAHGVDRPYATIIVDKLERLGFVERRPHPSDRRSKIVSLTPAGRDAAALRALDAGQLTELIGLLSQLN